MPIFLPEPHLSRIAQVASVGAPSELGAPASMMSVGGRAAIFDCCKAPSPACRSRTRRLPQILRPQSTVLVLTQNGLLRVSHHSSGQRPAPITMLSMLGLSPHEPSEVEVLQFHKRLKKQTAARHPRGLHPRPHRRLIVLESDRRSVERKNAHGSAMRAMGYRSGFTGPPRKQAESEAIWMFRHSETWDCYVYYPSWG
jgi:hypothetical protein